MGFTRRQVAEAVVTSATLLGLAAAVVGVVVGIAGARWGWRVIAQSFGVASGPVLTPSVLLAGAAAALLVANLAAAVPAAGAVRRRPAEALRVE
jgi:ABC-type antimicrobial peptide transport system permease subunit